MSAGKLNKSNGLESSIDAIEHIISSLNISPFWILPNLPHVAPPHFLYHHICIGFDWRTANIQCIFYGMHRIHLRFIIYKYYIYKFKNCTWLMFLPAAIATSRLPLYHFIHFFPVVFDRIKNSLKKFKIKYRILHRERWWRWWGNWQENITSGIHNENTVLRFYDAQ